MGFTRHGKQPHSELEDHHAINGKTHYFDWPIFNSYVKLPEGTCRNMLKYVEICLNMLNYICLYISFPWSSIVITCNDQPGFLPGNPQVSFVKPPSNLVGG
jgi:hypothetical protein